MDDLSLLIGSEVLRSYVGSSESLETLFTKLLYRYFVVCRRWEDLSRLFFHAGMLNCVIA